MAEEEKTLAQMKVHVAQNLEENYELLFLSTPGTGSMCQEKDMESTHGVTPEQY